VSAALDQVAAWIAANPFNDRFPVALAGVIPVTNGDRPLVTEPAGSALPLRPGSDVLSLLAVSGGASVDLFGEWNGWTLIPLSVHTEGSLVSL
jgi:hypothetical protein